MNAATIEIGPNVVAALALICSALTAYLQQKTRRELKPNGGTSLRDAVDRIEHHAEVAAGDAVTTNPPTKAQDLRDRPLGGA